MGSQPINWAAVTGIVAACGLISTFAVFAISAIVDRKLTGFLTKLDGTYLRREFKEMADERYADHSRRIQALEEKVN